MNIQSSPRQHGLQKGPKHQHHSENVMNSLIKLNNLDNLEPMSPKMRRNQIINNQSILGTQILDRPSSRKILNLLDEDELPFIKSHFNELHRPIRVLIVDDERLIRNTITKFISRIADEEKMNFESIDCENGFEGLHYMYKACKFKTPINIVITDETMPFMKGSMMINIISNCIKEGTFEKARIISYTSYNTEEKKNYILSQGADMIKIKPISYSDFKIMIKNIIF